MDKTIKIGKLRAQVVEDGDDPVYELPGITDVHGRSVRISKSQIDSVRRNAQEYRDRTRFAKRDEDVTPAADDPSPQPDEEGAPE